MRMVKFIVKQASVFSYVFFLLSFQFAHADSASATFNHYDNNRAFSHTNTTSVNKRIDTNSTITHSTRPAIDKVANTSSTLGHLVNSPVHANTLSSNESKPFISVFTFVMLVLLMALLFTKQPTEADYIKMRGKSDQSLS